MHPFQQSLDDKVAVLRDAIRSLKQVTGLCNDLPREFCPHVLGTKRGEWQVLVWQFDGLSEKGTVPGWRCFELRDLDQIASREGEWHRGYSTGQREQTCVDQIDTSVDPAHAAELRESERGHIRWPAVQRRYRKKR
jgi:hypothetical protein